MYMLSNFQIIIIKYFFYYFNQIINKIQILDYLQLFKNI